MAVDSYNPAEIEPKWQQYWREQSLFATPAEIGKDRYVLDMFPYPSGDGLHVGHVKIYTASDVISRYLRMRGYNVLHPMGWDAFGLPTENTAIKKQIHPATLTEQNVERFRGQMQSLGFSYDWQREVNTTDPAYYKWTQWIFLKLYEMGLAYEDTIPINWCPNDKTGLANEEVIDGKCDRCGAVVEQKPMRQWLLKITRYADQLLEGLEGLEWPPFILDLQRNWIGRKEGINIAYPIKDSTDTVTCFTTRPDTNFGATFVVIAPEHELARRVAKEKPEVQEYIERALHKTDLERQEDGRTKTGVFTGQYAVNQLTGQDMPIWVSDFVLGHFGTGAVVGVPGHDLRDFEFAQAVGLPIVRVVVGPDGDTSDITTPQQVQEEAGTMVNSGFLDGLPIVDAIERMKDYLEQHGYGKRVVSYSLRDWVFSRQRYWGEPIPIIHCEQCGTVPVPEEDLPVELPDVERYEPTGTGESPLAAIDEWVNVVCPRCQGPAKRETNTMPQWAGSSWYFLRFADPHNERALASPEAMKRWLPVDLYIGGAEHAVLHLLYARFWTRALHDAGVVPFIEPFLQLRSVGLVMGEDGQKMSKSRGNVVNPDDEIAAYGADTARVFAMFMGPFEGSAPWSTSGIAGSQRFVKRLWETILKLAETDGADSDEVRLALNRTIKRVSEGTEQFRFNTSVAACMEFLNLLEQQEQVSKQTLETFVLLLAPYTPHLAEELWQRLGHNESTSRASWPDVDTALLAQANVEIPVQVNGKVRGTLTVAPGWPQADLEAQARQLPNVAKHLNGVAVARVVYVKDRLLNFVVE